MKKRNTLTIAEILVCEMNNKKSSELTWDYVRNVLYNGASVYTIPFNFFKKITLPSELEALKDDIAMTIVLKYGSLQVLSRYLDSSGTVTPLSSGGTVEWYALSSTMQITINNLTYKWLGLLDTTTLSYDPISNYDRTETTTTTHTNKETMTTSKEGAEKLERTGDNITRKDGAESVAHSGTDSLGYTGSTTTTPDGATTTTHFNSAFNEPNELTVESKDTTSYDGMTTVESYENRKDTTTYDTTDTTTYDNRTDTTTYSDSEERSFTDRKDVSDATKTGTDTVTSNIKGNIGVTTSQQMIEAERSVVDFNLVDIIAYDLVYPITTGIYIDLYSKYNGG